MEVPDKVENLFMVNIAFAWPKWSVQIFYLNKNVDLLNFQFCGGVLQHPQHLPCVRAYFDIMRNTLWWEFPSRFWEVCIEISDGL